MARLPGAQRVPVGPTPQVKRAKRHSRRHNVSISRLVTNYLAGLDEPKGPLPSSRTVNRLRGILPPDVTVEEHRDHLDKKYR